MGGGGPSCSTSSSIGCNWTLYLYKYLKARNDQTPAGIDSPNDADSKTFYRLKKDQKLNLPNTFKNREN